MFFPPLRSSFGVGAASVRPLKAVGPFGGGLLFQQTDLSAVQLQGMNTTPVLCVNAPAANQLIVPVMFVFEVTTTVAYTNNPAITWAWDGTAVAVNNGSVGAIAWNGAPHFFYDWNIAVTTIAENINRKGTGLRIRLSADLTGGGVATARTTVFFTTYASRF